MSSNDLTLKIGVDSKAAKKELAKLHKMQFKLMQQIARNKDKQAIKDEAARKRAQRQEQTASDQVIRQLARESRARDAAAKKRFRNIQQGQAMAKRAHAKEMAQAKERADKSIQVAKLVGAAALVGMTASVKIAAELEYEMTRVEIITKSTALEFDKLSKQVSSLGRSTIFSSKEIAEGVRFLAMSGMSATEAFRALPSVLGIAEVGMMGLGAAADISTNILAGYGETAADLGKRTDQLTATFTNSNTTLTEMGEAFKNAGPVAHTANIAFEDVAATLGMLGNAGFKGERAGVGVRNMLANLVKPTKDAKSALYQLNISAKDLREDGLMGVVDILRETTAELEPEAKLALLIQAFGRRAGPQMAALLNQSKEKFHELREEIDGAAGSMEKFQKQMGATTQGKFKKATSAAKGLGEALGEGLKRPVDSLLDSFIFLTNGITDAIKKFNEWDRLLATGEEPAQVKADREAREADQLRSKLGRERDDKIEALEKERALIQDKNLLLFTEGKLTGNIERAGQFRIAQLNEEIRLLKKARDVGSWTRDDPPSVGGGGKGGRKGRGKPPDARRRRGSSPFIEGSLFGQYEKDEFKEALRELEARLEKENALRLRSAEDLAFDVDKQLQKQRDREHEARLEAHDTEIQEEKRRASMIAAIRDAENQNKIDNAQEWNDLLNGLVVGPALNASQQMFDGMITGQENWAAEAAASFMAASGGFIVGKGLEVVATGVGKNAVLMGSGMGEMAAGVGLIGLGVSMGAGATALRHVSAGGVIGQAIPDSGVSSGSGGGFQQREGRDPDSRQLVINLQFGVAGPHPNDAARAVMDMVRLGESRGF